MNLDLTTLGNVGWEVLKLLLPAISSVLIVLVTALAKKLLDHIGIQHNAAVDQAIDNYVSVGVNYAERAAQNAAADKGLSGEDKLSLATKTVLHELEQANIVGVTEALVKARIESYLQTSQAVNIVPHSAP